MIHIMCLARGRGDMVGHVLGTWANMKYYQVTNRM